MCRTCGAPIRYCERRQARMNRCYCSWACRQARPLKLADADPHAALVAWLAEAPNLTAAAELHGVSRQTLRRWCRRYAVGPYALVVRPDRRRRPQLAWWA